MSTNQDEELLVALQVSCSCDFERMVSGGVNLCLPCEAADAIERLRGERDAAYKQVQELSRDKGKLISCIEKCERFLDKSLAFDARATIKVSTMKSILSGKDGGGMFGGRFS